MPDDLAAACRLLRSNQLCTLREMSRINHQLQLLGKHPNLPDITRLLDQFNAANEELQDLQQLMENYREQGILQDQPLLDGLITRRMGRVAAATERISRRLEHWLASLPRGLPRYSLQPDGSLRPET